MSRRTILMLVLATAMFVATGTVTAAQMGTAFTYQGHLTDDGDPGNGEYDFQFTLCRDDACTDVVGTVTKENESVTDGLFTVELDFGDDGFTGDARWLELGVRPGDSGGEYEILDPRQELTPAPYSIRAWTGVGGPDGLNVAPDGSVGIGTTTPTSKLEIAGTAGVDGIKFPDGSVQTTAHPVWTKVGDDIFYTAGSVGIGTTSFVPGGDMVVTKDAVLPSARDSLACAADPTTGKIYCFGGWDGATRFDEIVEYDPDTDTCTTMTAVLPSGRNSLACAASSTTGKIYCFGGFDGTWLDEIVEYDPGTDTLVTKSATLPWGRSSLACATDPATGKIYCFGGYAGGPYTDEIIEYDPGIPDVPGPIPIMDAVLPSARTSLACAASPTTGKIYCFGGYYATGSLDEIVEYDPGYPYAPDEPIATMDAVLPSARGSLACAADPGAGRIFCFGGAGGSDEIVEYTPPPTDTCTTTDATLPSGRYNLACAAGPGTGKIYCFGGLGVAYLDEIVEFTRGPVILQVGDPGDGTGAIANTWSVFSSREFKRDIAPLKPADYQDILNKLKATEAVRFSYAHDARRTLHLGVIAEDSPAEILSPGGKAVSLADYATFLMAAIKAQQAMIEEKDCQIAEVQARVRELEARMDKLGHTEEGGVR